MAALDIIIMSTRWKKRTVPVALCLMRKRKGLSTVIQGGEDRASKMAAKHKSKHVRNYNNKCTKLKVIITCYIDHSHQTYDFIFDSLNKYSLVAADAFVPSSFTTILAFWSALDTYTGSAPEGTVTVNSSLTHIQYVSFQTGHHCFLLTIWYWSASAARMMGMICNNILVINSDVLWTKLYLLLRNPERPYNCTAV